MGFLAFNRALLGLFRFQAIAKVRKLGRAFSSRRRALLSLTAVFLLAVWLGNAVASVLFRERYDPETFHRGVSLTLMLYFLWHVARVAYNRPEHAIEWTPAERDFLCGGPFTQRELLTYRLTVILSATLPKAALATLLLWPDLPRGWSGFAGILLALLFLEHVRVVLETVAWGVPRRAYLIARSVVLAGLVIAAAGSLWASVQTIDTEATGRWSDTLVLFKEWARTLSSFRETSFGRLCEAPFAAFALVVTARRLSWGFAGSLAIAAGIVAASTYLAVRLDEFFHRVVLARERKNYGPTPPVHDAAPGDRQIMRLRLPRVPRWGGVGPLAWRQLKSARHQVGSLAVALGIPGVLACLPLTAPRGPTITYLSVVASVTFYSFILLPTALKFDFRRDFDRLLALKMLPFRPAAVVLGQVAVPVLLATGFQVAVFGIAACVCPVPLFIVGSAMLLMIPTNVLCVAVDNLLFLLYPHRLGQEGLEVFLRTTLTFTAKAVLLGFAGTLVVYWVRAAGPIAHFLGLDGGLRLVFVVGVIGMTTAAAALALYLTVRIFARNDLSLEASA